METNERIAVRAKQPAPEVGSYAGEWFEPLVDIYETAEALTVVADVPGVAADDITTDLKENLLTISARTRQPSETASLRHRELDSGHYTRQFRLGQLIDQSKITAQLRDGVLTLVLPKLEHARPKRIQVQSE